MRGRESEVESQGLSACQVNVEVRVCSPFTWTAISALVTTLLNEDTDTTVHLYLLC